MITRIKALSLCIFYVYALFDAYGIVRYIGKGKGNRWLEHEKCNDKSNWIKHRFIKQTLRALGEVPKVKIRENLSEAEAFAIELAFIKAIGRYPNGPLYNLTDNRCGPSSETIRDWHASRTPEERSASGRKAQAAMTPEQRSERARKNAIKIGIEVLAKRLADFQALMSPQERQEIARQAGIASNKATTLEQKQAAARKGHESYMTNTTPEKRRENYKKTGVAKLTKEQLSTNGTKGVTKANASRTPEERSALGRKANAALTWEQRSASSLRGHSKRTKESKTEAGRKAARTRRQNGGLNNHNKGRRLICNGVEIRMLDVGEQLPEGWRFGFRWRLKKNNPT